MRRPLVASLAALALVASAGAGGSTVLALKQGKLLRLDAATLGRVDGPRLDLAGGAWTYSPHRRLLAVAENRLTGSVFVVDPSRLRRVREIPGVGAITAVAWLAPNRLLAVGYSDLVVVDPVRGRALERRTLEGLPYAVRKAGRALVLLVAPLDGIGPARVLRVDASGRSREVVLDQIAAGATRPDASGLGAEYDRPGIAVAPDGRRAWVVGETSVAEVSLPAMAVTYRSLVLRSTASAAKASVPGFVREAVLTGGATLAVSGADLSPADNPGQRGRETAAGVTLVDTGTWRVRRIAPEATHVATAGRLLLAFGGVRGRPGTGLRAYVEGRLQFGVFTGRTVNWVQVAGDRAYTSLGSSILGIDLDRRTVVARLDGPFPQLLLGTMREW